MKLEKDDQQESDLPKPALRALVAACYLRLEQFTKLSELEVHQLHGVGPKALGQLRRALWLLTVCRLPIKNDFAYIIKKDTSL